MLRGFGRAAGLARPLFQQQYGLLGGRQAFLNRSFLSSFSDEEIRSMPLEKWQSEFEVLFFFLVFFFSFLFPSSLIILFSLLCRKLPVT